MQGRRALTSIHLLLLGLIFNLGFVLFHSWGLDPALCGAEQVYCAYLRLTKKNEANGVEIITKWPGLSQEKVTKPTGESIVNF